MNIEAIDWTWQVQALASVVLAFPAGIALRRWIDKFDRRRDRRMSR